MFSFEFQIQEYNVLDILYSIFLFFFFFFRSFLILMYNFIFFHLNTNG